MRVLILGRHGNISRSLHALLASGAFPSVEGTFLGSKDLDLLDSDKLAARLDQLMPEVLINAAAYTNVSGAETDAATAFRLNADAPSLLASWCARHGRLLVHYSTDYVYDGSTQLPWTEDSAAGPLNRYGASKLQGDQLIQQSGCQHLIFRVSWIYACHGTNFVTTMLRVGNEKEALSVVDDQIGSPTLADDVALHTLRIVGQFGAAGSVLSGVYHMTNEGFVSWYDFAKAIFAGARARGLPVRVQTLTPVSSEQYGGMVIRPKNARLCKEKLWHTFRMRLPAWSDALGRCLDAIADREAKRTCRGGLREAKPE
jgi:dTDP-4-dehydrorhamnose reductase